MKEHQSERLFIIHKQLSFHLCVHLQALLFREADRGKNMNGDHINHSTNMQEAEKFHGVWSGKKLEKLPSGSKTDKCLLEQQEGKRGSLKNASFVICFLLFFPTFSPCYSLSDSLEAWNF